MKRALAKNKIESGSHSSNQFIRNSTEGSFFSSSLFNETPFISPSTAPSSIMPKLEIGEPNDKYEKEADAMADQVVNNTQSTLQMSSDDSVSNGIGSPIIQRLSEEQSPAHSGSLEIENEQEGVAVQPMREPTALRKEPIVSKTALDSNRQGGKKLDDSTRSTMESQFGSDFGNVSIHDNSTSQRFASSINARAFAYGSDIYFNKGEYQPDSTEGKRTLAHELTHVVQQGGAGKMQSTEPKIQRMGPLGALLANDVAPWAPQRPFPQGSDYTASTDAGNGVRVWKAYSPYDAAHSYWCHGHSLGTYAAFGYSVYSGTGMQQAVNDEWRNIPPAQAQAGDIAVWTTNFEHSAKFVKPVITGGQLDPAASMLSTKNGLRALATMSLNGIIGVYGSAGIAVYRHV